MTTTAITAHSTIDYIAAYATLGTALGTIVLAIATFTLAKKTASLAESGEQELALLRDQTQAAMRHSEAAEAALNASVAPLILDVPPRTLRPGPLRTRYTERAGRSEEGKLVTDRPDIDVSVITWDADRSPAWLRIPIRNVGAGLALLDAASLTVEGEDGSWNVLDAAPEDIPSVVPPGEIRQLVFVSEDTSLNAMVVSDDPLVVEVSYADVSGEQGAATILYVAKASKPRRHMYVRDVLPAVDHRLTADPRLPAHRLTRSRAPRDAEPDG